MRADVVVIGGGAAGLMCAAVAGGGGGGGGGLWAHRHCGRKDVVHAGARGRGVVLLEHNETVGRKIAISGGGRCNFTNTGTAAKNFISSNPHFAKSALARYTPADFIALVERHGIRYHEKKLGQLFCNESSRQIIEMLLGECEDARVEVRTATRVRAVRKDVEVFTLETNRGEFESESLVIATGGLSIPKL